MRVTLAMAALAVLLVGPSATAAMRWPSSSLIGNITLFLEKERYLADESEVYEVIGYGIGGPERRYFLH